jgi:hypothetical protein
MLKGWRIGRTLVRKKSGLLNRVCYFFFDDLGSTNAQCHARISEHIHYQIHKYPLWVSIQGVCY